MCVCVCVGVWGFGGGGVDSGLKTRHDEYIFQHIMFPRLKYTEFCYITA